MYTTIEPRLIALLNDESFDVPPSLELPPLHDPNIFKASGGPLLLEPDASNRATKQPTSSQIPQHSTLSSSIDDDDSIHKAISELAPAAEVKSKQSKDNTLRSSSPQSLRRILDDESEASAALPAKKRHLVDSLKDDFVQLPQPPKKQKTAKQVVPPIIIGLFEPPPQAALFPPIASSSFHDSHGRNSLNTESADAKDPNEIASREAQPEDVRKRKMASSRVTQETRSVQRRKKWSEEETNNLLLGVHKHGIGKWTDILEDSNFPFNNRSAADLKDRFRTCCPVELRGKPPKPRRPKPSSDPSRIQDRKRSKSSLMYENILIGQDGHNVAADTEGTTICTTTRPRRSRAHRKELADLAQLGIEGPFKKSERRERKPFSGEDDREILKGYTLFGPAWSRIQRDPQFHLQSRRPTDLRDRFRNKYPEKFRAGENAGCRTTKATSSQTKEDLDEIGAPSTTALQPPSTREALKVQEMISSEPRKSTPKPPHLQLQTSLYSLRENVLSLPYTGVDSTDGLPFTQSFDWSDSITAPFNSSIGDVDIPRSLLEEAWLDHVPGPMKQKQSFTDINSIITSSTDPLPPGSSFYNMLAGEPEQLLERQTSAALEHDASFE